ncbi:PepSY domain-containing protein [[Enterobacter] lignolyticus]|uniref:Propeptide PepSY amd peptidase M4 n=2 Tax=[Enterobacter] lignolyticus TaxID=1334193 RepID=E3G4H0_ENTLS|nr:PepSY domain-containing protein [[Enterobacter] lignolyticus]ADO48283.1 Propeptide PepSY amd peptidase M4 [[Enterobacter] lignolyticus SCF1]ALR77001.1 hypothetical protein AO703_12045 [[Enterobacter] lignolyticus]
MRKVTVIPAVMLVMAVCSASAFASSHDDEMAVVKNKVTLIQAISTAEKHVNGVASKAEFEISKSVPVYEIHVVQGQKVHDVKVDANSGAVISSKME